MRGFWLDKVLKMQVDCCYQYAYQHDRYRPDEEPHKMDGVSFALRHTGDDNVGGSADQRSVAAEAGTERQGPPDRHHGFTSAHGSFH